MNKHFFLFASLIACQFVFAQKQVTNLHYVWTEHFTSPKKTDVKELWHYNFNWNPETQIFVAGKTKNESDKVYPRYTIDGKRKILVVQMAKSNEYLLEEMDSFFVKGRLKLEPIAETKTIKGFKCHGYSFKNDVTLKVVGARSPVINEEYSIWVTDELTWNDAFNPYVMALLRTQSAEGAEFKGVIVEFDYKMSYGQSTWNNIIDLDISKLDQKPEPITWPWEMNDGVAWLEIPVVNSGNTTILHPGWTTDGGNGGVYRIGDGSVQIMNTRLKLLLREITGQEKPKTKMVSFQNIIVGPWGN